MVTLATAERLVPPLAAPARDARPLIAAALLHAGVAASLLLGWRDMPSEAPGSFAVSLVLEPAPAASGAAEAMPQAAPPPPPEPPMAATEPILPAEPEPEIAAAPADPPASPAAEPALQPEVPAAFDVPPTAKAVPEPEVPVATAEPAPAPVAAPPPPLPAAKPMPPHPAAAQASPSPARTAGDRRSTVDAPETRDSAAGSSIEPAAPVMLDRPHYRERPAPPRYPMRARELEQQGLVLVRARLDPIGDPVEVEVLRSSGFRLLDEAAAEAVRQWRFVPARRNGHGVEALVQIPVRFTLN